MKLPLLSLLILAASLPAQVPTPATPLGLPRLRAQPPNGAPASLKAADYDIDTLDLPANGRALGLRKESQGSSEVLKIAADKELVRPLKTSPGKVAYYSFLVYGSPYSVLSFEGVSLAFAASPVSGAIELMVGVEVDGKLSWRSTNQHLSVDTYGGQRLAGSPVLTVRVDPKAGEWDLFSGPRQVASNLPLLPDAGKGAKRELVLHGGTDGLWLAGFVQSSANPLFEDANDNGVDDAFERSKGGSLQGANASGEDRRALAAAARADALTKTPEAWFLDRPRPDRALPATPAQ
jgi:hypothetical protein